MSEQEEYHKWLEEKTQYYLKEAGGPYRTQELNGLILGSLSNLLSYEAFREEKHEK